MVRYYSEERTNYAFSQDERYWYAFTDKNAWYKAGSRYVPCSYKMLVYDLKRHKLTVRQNPLLGFRNWRNVAAPAR